MLQFISQLIPVFFAILIVYLTYRISIIIKNADGFLHPDFDWVIENTPALDAFLMFAIQTVLVVTASVCSFRQVSNHIILTLDIIFFISVMMLILFHTLKEAGNLLVKEIR